MTIQYNFYYVEWFYTGFITNNTKIVMSCFQRLVTLVHRWNNILKGCIYENRKSCNDS